MCKEALRNKLSLEQYMWLDDTDSVPLTGPLAVKAAIWVLVEELHYAGIGKLHLEPVTSAKQVIVGWTLINSSKPKYNINCNQSPVSVGVVKQCLYRLIDVMPCLAYSPLHLA